MEELRKKITKEHIRMVISTSAAVGIYAFTEVVLSKTKNKCRSFAYFGCMVLQFYCATEVYTKISRRFKEVDRIIFMKRLFRNEYKNF